jgi:pyocin large subunit-like protein
LIFDHNFSYQEGGKPAMSRLLTIVAALAAVSALAACDGGPASKPSRDQADAGPASPGGSVSNSDTAVETAAGAVDGLDGPSPKVDPRTQPAPLLDGKPIWAANRRLTAREAAEKQFARNGESFGAKTLNDYVRKAHAFVESPPPGAEIIRRPYGVVIYDAKSNTFAAMDKDGAPRAMFKPDDGAAYWAKEKARADRGSRGERRRDRDAGA